MAQSSYDSFLVDLDGTANIGDLPVPYAVDALNTFGDCVVYVTNNASRSPDTVHHRLKRIGYNTDVQHIVTSAQLAAQVMKKDLSLIHISEPTRRLRGSRMPSSA